MSDGNILDQMIENQENGTEQDDDTKDGVALLNNQVWGSASRRRRRRRHLLYLNTFVHPDLCSECE